MLLYECINPIFTGVVNKRRSELVKLENEDSYGERAEGGVGGSCGQQVLAQTV